MVTLAAQHQAEQWAGQGRLVVRHTFLDLVEDSDEIQPSIQRRSHTDSALWRQALLEYSTGCAPALREHGEGSDSDDAHAPGAGAIGTCGPRRLAQPARHPVQPMVPLKAQHQAEQWTGQGRLVVRHTFLDLVEVEDSDEPQPSVQRRSHTDSALWRQALLEYRTGCAPALREHGEGSDSDDTHAPGAGAIGTSSDRSSQPSEHGGGNETDRSTREPRKATGRCNKRTSLMLRNLPNNYSRQMLLDMFDAAGFAAQYDFVYLPRDFSRGCGLGYAFVNLVSADVVPKFRAAFDGFRDWVIPSAKICQVSFSEPHQGLKAHVKRYRNSPVMHPSVPDEYKPCIFDQGRRVPFPAPGCRIARPQARSKA